MIYGEISDETWWGDEVTPRKLADDLKRCEGKPLNVHVNSPGGDVFAAQAIYNQLKSYSGAVTMYIDGLCASAATIITCAGDLVIMPDNAVFMIHNPKTAALGYFDAEDLQKMSEQLETVKQTIVNVYKKRCQDALTEDEIKEMMDEEKWMSAQEAAENGFIDQIDEAITVKNSMNGDKITMNAMTFSVKRFKNTEKLQEILNKKECPAGKEGKTTMSKGNDEKSLLEKIKDLIGQSNSEPATPPKQEAPAPVNEVQAERQRMIALDTMDDKSNPVIARIIDAAKKNGAKPEDVQVFVDAAKGEEKQASVLDAITALIKDQTSSGADGVTPTPNEAKGPQAKLQKEVQQRDEIVNLINGMRGAK
nr:head maturation protease, ClpP-related [Pectinatus frisingensis]